MDSIQKLAAEVALQKMIRQGFFSICTIDAIIQISGCIPDRRAYDTLRLLHCVEFKDFPKPLLKEFPDLLRDVLSNNSLEINIFSKRESAIEVSETPSKRWWQGLLK